MPPYRKATVPRLTCPSDCPIPGALGWSEPDGLCTNGVLIMGEALGDQECEDGLAFRPQAPAGSVLERAIRRSGFSREQFGLWNVVPAQPPNNWLEGAPYEAAAIAWGLQHLPPVIARFQPRVILALGNVPLKALTELSGITGVRGYPLPSRWDIPVIASFHPAYLRRGAMSHLGVLMHDLRFAVALAAARPHDGVYTADFWSPVLWRQVSYDIPWPIPPTCAIRPQPLYQMFPLEADAEAYLRDCEAHPDEMIAYDIETPYGATKEIDEDDDDDSKILSIQFSRTRETGIFFPWRGAYIEVARRILALGNPKVGANNWRYDQPRLLANGCPIAGVQHDLRWAWKHFQPDLPASLQFITSFYAPDASPWKQLAQVQPRWYGIRDVDMTLRCF